MIIFHRPFNKYIFEGRNFRVFWSNRGYWSAGAENAGSFAGLGNGIKEASGNSPHEAVLSLTEQLEMRREYLETKLKECKAVIEELKTIQAGQVNPLQELTGKFPS